MTSIFHLKALCIAAILGLTTVLAIAGAGHDQGESPAAVAGPMQPRFIASSELFELVGVLNGTTLTLYLDSAEDNSPLQKAQLEVEIGGAKVEIKGVGEGLFEAQLSSLPKEGLLSVTATVVAAIGSDLLVGELDIHTDTNTHPPEAETKAQFKTIAGWGAGIVLAMGVFLFSWKRARTTRTTRATRIGEVA